MATATKLTKAEQTISNGLAVVDRRIDGLLKSLASAYPGNRNKTLYWVAIEMSRPTPDYAELLVETARELGLGLEEILRTINSAIKGREQYHARSAERR
jgi:hypothetical protein